jgi:hypothetical protein
MAIRLVAQLSMTINTAKTRIKIDNNVLIFIVEPPFFLFKMFYTQMYIKSFYWW